MTPQQLAHELKGFIGTEEYHRLTLLNSVVGTDGVKFLADNAGAYWLIDMIASHLPSIPRSEQFAIVRYAGTPGASGIFSLTDDIPANQTYAVQHIEFSDFPLDEIVMYVQRGGPGWVVMLRSEY